MIENQTALNLLDEKLTNLIKYHQTHEFIAACKIIRQNQPQTFIDAGYLISTIDFNDSQLFQAMELLLHEDTAGAGSQILIGVLLGLRTARRFQTLNLLTKAIILPVFSLAFKKNLQTSALDILEILLLGYQHSPDIFLFSLPQFDLLLDTFEQYEESEFFPILVSFNSILQSLFYLHRLYQRDFAFLQHRLEHLPRPSIVQICDKLRKYSWLSNDCYPFPWIEGYWKVEDDAHLASLQQGGTNRNGGSCILRVKSVCKGNLIEGSIEVNENSGLSSKILLEGCTYHLNTTDTAEATSSSSSSSTISWALQAHWRQLKKNSHQQYESSSTSSLPWICSKCTMENEANNSQCSACNSPSPSKKFATIHGSSEWNNPAPLVMKRYKSFNREIARMFWSRGDRSGVWFGWKEEIMKELEWKKDYKEKGNEELQTDYLCYNTSKGITVGKSFTFGSRDDFTIECWFAISSLIPSSIKDSSFRCESLLSNGEYKLFLELETSLNHYLLYIVFQLGQVELRLPLNYEINFFTHIALILKDNYLSLYLNGEFKKGIQCEGKRDQDVDTKLPLVFGPRSNSKEENSLTVFLCDIRLWTIAISQQDLIERKHFLLNEKEEHLLGSWLLLGDDARYLMDRSIYGNHGTLLTDLDLDCTELCIDFPLEKCLLSCPIVYSFTRVVKELYLAGNVDFFNSIISFSKRKSSKLNLSSKSHLNINKEKQETKEEAKEKEGEEEEDLFGGVFWPNRPLLASGNLQIEVCCNPLKQGNISLILSSCSFWKLDSHLDKISYLYGKSKTFLSSSLPVILLDFNSNSVSLNIFLENSMHTLLKLSHKHSNSKKITLNYQLNTFTLNVLLDEDFLFSIPFDLERVLRIHSLTQHVWIGIGSLFHQEINFWKYSTNQSQSGSSSCSPGGSSDGSTTASTTGSSSNNSCCIYQVYHIKEEENEKEKTIFKSDKMRYCSKHDTDGSAFPQEFYGCSSCGLIHGQGICTTCAVLCHEGHELIYMGKVSAACNCNSRSYSHCSCLQGIEREVLSNVFYSSWKCEMCTFISPISDSICSVCGTPRTITTITSTTTTTPGSTLSTSTSLVSLPTTSYSIPSIPTSSSSTDCWTCQNCTVINKGNERTCSVCNKTREMKNMNLINESSLASNNITSWMCAACTMLNSSQSDVCITCGTSIKEWTCKACTIRNSKDSMICSVCTTPRDDPMITSSLPNSSSLPDSPSLPTTTIQSKEELKEIKRKEDNLKLLIKSNKEELNIDYWDLTIGRMNLSLNEEFTGQVINGDFTETKGKIKGILWLQNKEDYILKGMYRNENQFCWNAFDIKFNKNCSFFTGWWFRGDGSAEWNSKRISDIENFRGHKVNQPFACGLVNMKDNLSNVCYQNSFLQALMMTDSLRELLLFVPLNNEMNISSSCSSLLRENTLFYQLRNLFSSLSLSQRSSLHTKDLQQCLPQVFITGRQQDTSDFAHYLFDQLDSGFQFTILPDALRRVYGGTQATVLHCKKCSFMSTKTEYFWELMLNMVDLRYTAITDLQAVVCDHPDVPTPSGYERLNYDLNKDRERTPYIFLCVKRGDERQRPITDITIKVSRIDQPKPSLSGFERLEVNLNQGESISLGSNQVYLFYKRDVQGSPITDLSIVYGDDLIPDGFRQIRVDLNQEQGTKVFLCYRCDMPVRDIQIASEGIPGYKTIDSSLNLSSLEKEQYICHTDGGSLPCITGIQLISSNELNNALKEGLEQAGEPLADGNVLVVKRGEGNPLYAVDVFRAPRKVPKYKEYEVIDLIDSNTLIPSIVGEWKADEETTNSSYKVVKFLEPRDIGNIVIVEGTYSNRGVGGIGGGAGGLGGDIKGFLIETSHNIWKLNGIWKDHNTKYYQYLTIEVSYGMNGRLRLIGSASDAKNPTEVELQALQISNRTPYKEPITDIIILRDNEILPEGFIRLEHTVSGRSGNLVANTPSPYRIYLCYKRGGEKSPIKDIAVIYGEIDSIPSGFIPIYQTPYGSSANLNEGTKGVAIYLCYRSSVSSSFPSSNKVEEPYLMDIGLLWTSGPHPDSLPSGYTKIQTTPLGMEANLNQGTIGQEIYLCYQKTLPYKRPLLHAINGDYSSNWGEFVLYGTQRVHAFTLQGRFSSHSSLFNLNQQHQHHHHHHQQEQQEQHGNLEGFLYCLHLNEEEYKGEEITDSIKEWKFSGQSLSSNLIPGCFEISFDSKFSLGKGWWSTGIEGGNWNIVKDNYLQIAYKKDYGTEWKEGVLSSTERVTCHDLSSMLSRFVSPRTLGGENGLECSNCLDRREFSTQTVIVQPPECLILTLKRMYYDWNHNKTIKSLHDVLFPVVLELPSIPIEYQEKLYDTKKQANQAKNRMYGVYAVVVHSGISASSGHYYTYARNSNGKGIHQKDSPDAPWIKFNDMKVEFSSWDDMCKSILNSVSDSVYLLFYTKLADHLQEKLKKQTTQQQHFKEQSKEQHFNEQSKEQYFKEQPKEQHFNEQSKEQYFKEQPREQYFKEEPKEQFQVTLEEQKNRREEIKQKDEENLITSTLSSKSSSSSSLTQDEDESMLLAQAMVLSMSATSPKEEIKTKENEFQSNDNIQETKLFTTTSTSSAIFDKILQENSNYLFQELNQYTGKMYREELYAYYSNQSHHKGSFGQILKEQDEEQKEQQQR